MLPFPAAFGDAQLAQNGQLIKLGSYISQKICTQNRYPGRGIKACFSSGRVQGPGNMSDSGGREGLGKVDGIWGLVAVILEPFKSLQRRVHLFVLGTLTCTSHDSAVAIPSEG